MGEKTLLMVFGIALVLAAPSGAALLPLQASVRYEIASLPPVTFAGSGVGASNGFGNAFTVPVGLFAGNPAIYEPISPTFIGLAALSVPASSVDHLAGSFGLDGPMGLSGSIFFENATGAAAGQLPLAPIGGGPTPACHFVPCQISVQAATWQHATAQVFTFMGNVLANPVSAAATAYDNRTAGGAGTVQLVAPASAKISVFGTIPLFGVLTLSYAPEPSTLLLLGGGVAALALLGRRKLARA